MRLVLYTGSMVRAGWSLNRDRRLTDVELRVLALMAEGWGNQEVADRMITSRKTVENYAHSIYRKLDLAGHLDVLAPRVCAVLFYLSRPDADCITSLPEHEHLRFGGAIIARTCSPEPASPR